MVAKRPFGGNSSDENPLEDVRGIIWMHMSTSILGWDTFFKVKQSSMFNALLVASGLWTRTGNLKQKYTRKINFT